MQVVVTGGAGYIGSHVCKALHLRGITPVVVDDLSHGHRAAVRWGPFEHIGLFDEEALQDVLERVAPVGVIHLASLIHARDSGKEPDAYYRVNVGGTIILAALLAQLGNIPLILSSSAAVYGMPDVTPIPEDHPKRPISPYGKSKAMAEEILADLHKAYGLGGVILRYFNAAGADLTGEIGEAHPIERHLIPLLLTAEEPVELFGDDPVRDYVHVADLAEAHVAALEKALREPGTLSTYNLGTGRGYSVREVVQMAESVVGRPIPTIQRGRNSADPLTLVADASRARQELGWLPHNSDLFTIVSSAWSWHRKNAFHLAGHTS